MEGREEGRKREKKEGGKKDKKKKAWMKLYMLEDNSIY